MIVLDKTGSKPRQLGENALVEGFHEEPTRINKHIRLNNQNFGKILTAQDPRIVQLALKFVF